MKITIKTGYRADMADILEGLNELMADLEDVRDEAQEQMENGVKGEIEADIRKMDEALKKLHEAADFLEDDDL